MRIRSLAPWLAAVVLTAGCGSPQQSSGVPSPATTPVAAHGAACSAVTVTVSPQSPIAAGTQVTATAQSSGCHDPVYRFTLVALSTGVGLVMRQWLSSDTWSWDTTGQQAGQYSIQVDVRAADEGADKVDASSQVELDLVEAPPNGSPTSGRCSAVTVAASPASPVVAGTAVTVTATATGCPAAEYRFQEVDLSTGVGLVMQDWGSANTWTWDTGGQQAGAYAIRVDARAYGAASANPDATAQVEVDVVHAAPSGSPAASRCTAVTISVSPASPVVAGTAVTATATATGCAAAEYRFQLVDLATGVGLVMQDWSGSDAWTWNTSGQAAGKYAIRVDVRGYGVASANPDATSQVEVDLTH